MVDGACFTDPGVLISVDEFGNIFADAIEPETGECLCSIAEFEAGDVFAPQE